ncbi:MAG: SRPBCC family protein [Rubrivivax sp.]|nr:SRPBCC family protein [Rubrivivax sp.]
MQAQRPDGNAPASEPWRDTLEHVVRLARPPADVYALVTNPSRWHEWHPNTRDVDAAADHSLGVGEAVIERIRVGPFRGAVTWKVTAAESGQRWVLYGDAGRGFESELEYTLQPDGQGTLFRRQVRLRWPWWFVFGGAATRTMAKDATAALANLQRVLVGPSKAGS